MEEWSYTSLHPLGHTGPVTALLYFLKVKRKILPYKLQRRYRGRVKVYLYNFFNLGARWGWVVG
jgi:hypothetical protein